MSTLPLSEVKARLSELAEEAHLTHERVQVTKNGHDYVVIMSSEDLESLEATLELLSDQAALAGLAEARQEVDSGNFTTLPEMDEVMRGRKQRAS